MLPTLGLLSCLFLGAQAGKFDHAVGAPGYGPNSDNYDSFIVVQGEEFRLNFTGCGNTTDEGCTLELWEANGAFPEVIETIDEKVLDPYTTFTLDNPLGIYQFQLTMREGKKWSTLAGVQIRSCRACLLTDEEEEASYNMTKNRPEPTETSKPNAGSIARPELGVVVTGLGFVGLFFSALL